MMSRIDCPTASVALYPKVCWAARFQEVIVPVRSCVMMAPSDDATAANRSAASLATLRTSVLQPVTLQGVRGPRRSADPPPPSADRSERVVGKGEPFREPV